MLLMFIIECRYLKLNVYHFQFVHRITQKKVYYIVVYGRKSFAVYFIGVTSAGARTCPTELAWCFRKQGGASQSHVRVGLNPNSKITYEVNATRTQPSENSSTNNPLRNRPNNFRRQPNIFHSASNPNPKYFNYNRTRIRNERKANKVLMKL